MTKGIWINTRSILLDETCKHHILSVSKFNSTVTSSVKDGLQACISSILDAAVPGLPDDERDLPLNVVHGRVRVLPQPQVL
jgi:hypothetical protein